MQDNTHANTQILYLLLQSERNHTTLFFWCVLQTAGAAARNAAINACNMPWIRALQLFELESADLITYNTAIEASDWQQAEGRISTRDGYYDTYMILFFVLLPRFMVFLLATGLLVTSLISCHCVVRAVLLSEGGTDPKWKPLRNIHLQKDILDICFFYFCVGVPPTNYIVATNDVQI